MNITRLLRHQFKTGNQIGVKINVRTGFLRGAHHLAGGSGHGGARVTPTKVPQPDGAKQGTSLADLANEPTDDATVDKEAVINALNVLAGVNRRATTSLVVEAINRMRHQLDTRAAAMCEALDIMNAYLHRLHMVEMNFHASSDMLIWYPPPYAAGGPLPSTPAEARNLSESECAAALDALEGAPGLSLVNSSGASHKQRLLNYLGIPA